MANKEASDENSSMDKQYVVGGETRIKNTITIYNDNPGNEIEEQDPIEFHLRKLVDSFEGRDNELKRLTSWFFTEKKKMAVISGPPGYGKTELAKQFVRLSKSNNKIKHILWMDAETPERLTQSFRNLARMLSFPEVDKETLISMIYDYFDQASSIIIFDNAKNRASVIEFEPPTGCLCLVTSHVKDWGDGVPSLELPPLAPDSAVGVLRSVLGDRYAPLDYSLYMDLAHVVSYVPLALQLNAAYVRQEMIHLGEFFNLEEYIDELKTSQEEFVDKSLPVFSANPYRISVYKSATKSLQKIETANTEQAKLALELLHICAYLYSENIVFSDLLKVSYIKKLLGDSKHPEKNLKRAVSILNNYFFVNFDDEQITMHRLMQETLIYHQTYLGQHHFYLECLEFILFDNNEKHRFSVIGRADKKLVTFFKFYLKYKQVFITHDMFFTVLVISGCTETLLKLFKDLGDCTSKLINEFYLLHDAAVSRQHPTLKLLLDHGADVNKINPEDENAIFDSAIKLDFKAAQTLTDAGADLNIQSKYGDTILHSIITASGPPWNDSQLDVAFKLFRWLVDHGARTDAVNKWLRSTLVHYAALALRPNFVELLVKEYGLDVNEKNALGRIPLHTVSDASKRWFLEKERRLETAKCLLELGSKLDVVDAFGRTPIQHARQEGFEYLAEYLEDPSGKSQKFVTENLINNDVLDKPSEGNEGNSSNLVHSKTMEDVRMDFQHVFDDLHKLINDAEAISHTEGSTQHQKIIQVVKEYVSSNRYILDNVLRDIRNTIRPMLAETGMLDYQDLIQSCFTEEQMAVTILSREANAGTNICSQMGTLSAYELNNTLNRFYYNQSYLHYKVDQTGKNCAGKKSPIEMQTCLIHYLYFIHKPKIDESERKMYEFLNSNDVFINRVLRDLKICFDIVSKKIVEDRLPIYNKFKKCLVEASSNVPTIY